MHNVSNAWKTNQNSQLRKKTDIKAYLFNGAKPDWARKYGALDFIYCKEAMSFSLVGTTNTIDFGFDTPIDITFGGQKGVKFDISPIYTDTTNHYSTQITLKDSSNNVIASFNLATIFINPTTYQNVSTIEFKVIGNEAGAIASARCRYFSITKPIELDSGDIESLEYKAHADVLNKDLPYHKIVVKTIEKPIPLSVMCAYFTIGYKGINNGNDEFIPLGCGYYYLDTASYDEFKQQYTFKDIISSLTQKYIWGDLQATADYYTIASRALNSRFSFLSIDATARSRGVPTTCVPNHDISLVPFTNTTVFPNEKSVAETLQMIAQASGLTLYVNANNIISFVDTKTTSITTDQNIFWILEKPKVSHSEKWRTLTINSYRYKNKGSEAITSIESGSPLGVYFVDVKGAYSNIQSSHTKNAGDVFTYNFIEQNITQTTFNITYTGVRFDLDIYYTSYYRSNAGDTDFTLDLEIASDPDLGVVSSHYTYWLNHWHNLNLNVRLDPKYTIGDVLKNDAYGSFIIEDIEATYNGGYSGAIKGRIITPKIKAPILKSKTITSATSYSFEIYNPNTDYNVDLLVAYNGGTLSFTISPLETITLDYSNASQLSTDVANWLVENLSSDVNAYFEYEDDYGSVVDSDNTILLETNKLHAPILSNLNLVSNTDYSFEITNDNDVELELYFYRSSGELYDTYTLQPHETMVFNYDNLSEISTDVYYWLLGELEDDVYCWFRNANTGITTDNTIILEANYE